CRARKPVYHGGSFGPDVAGAEEIIYTVRSGGIRFMEEFPWRFYPATIRLMELLASGLGSPQLVFCEHRVMVPEKNSAQFARAEAFSSDATLHMADWIRFLSSRDPTTIQSIAGPTVTHGPCHGFETLVIEFGDSCVGKATVRRFVQPKWTEAAQFRAGPSFHVV